MFLFNFRNCLKCEQLQLSMFHWFYVNFNPFHGRLALPSRQKLCNPLSRRLNSMFWFRCSRFSSKSCLFVLSTTKGGFFIRVSMCQQFFFEYFSFHGPFEMHSTVALGKGIAFSVFNDIFLWSFDDFILKKQQQSNMLILCSTAESDPLQTPYDFFSS